MTRLRFHDSELSRRIDEVILARLKAAEWFYAWLEPVFAAHPGITTAEAIALLMPEDQAA